MTQVLAENVLRCPKCGKDTEQDDNSFWCNECQLLWPKGYGLEEDKREINTIMWDLTTARGKLVALMALANKRGDSEDVTRYFCMMRMIECVRGLLKEGE